MIQPQSTTVYIEVETVFPACQHPTFNAQIKLLPAGMGITVAIPSIRALDYLPWPSKGYGLTYSGPKFINLCEYTEKPHNASLSSRRKDNHRMRHTATRTGKGLGRRCVLWRLSQSHGHPKSSKLPCRLTDHIRCALQGSNTRAPNRTLWTAHLAPC